MQAPDASLICGRCMGAITFVDPDQCCRRCGLPLGPFALDHDGRYCEGCLNLPLAGVRRTVAVGTYEGPLRRVICRFKYARNPHLARPLGALMAERVVAEMEYGPPDLIVPVPLHAARLKERTFDQALLLARAVSAALHVRLDAKALSRSANTPSLAHQSRQERADTVRGAFRAVRPEAVRGRRVLLVDDVMTTGATASECARTLRRAGAAEVTVSVLARTP